MHVNGLGFDLLFWIDVIGMVLVELNNKVVNTQTMKYLTLPAALSSPFHMSSAQKAVSFWQLSLSHLVIGRNAQPLSGDVVVFFRVAELPTICQ